MRRVLFLWVAAALAAADGPTIFYSWSLPGGMPPYAEVRVERNGEAVYREAPDDDQPVRFHLRRTEVDEVFGLAEKLDRFRRPLESGLKVANMGVKTFRYEGGGESNEVKFNFSRDLDARLLADWFARMTETERHFLNLERTVRFDKLGVNKVLLQMQVSMGKNRLVAAEQFLPLLERIIKNESYLNIARSRAAAIADAVRAANGAPE